MNETQKVYGLWTGANWQCDSTCRIFSGTRIEMMAQVLSQQYFQPHTKFEVREIGADGLPVDETSPADHADFLVQCHPAKDAIAVSKAMFEKYKQDAERLDWLDSHSVNGFSPIRPQDGAWVDNQGLRRGNVRMAIDACMQAENSVLAPDAIQ